MTLGTASGIFSIRPSTRDYGLFFGVIYNDGNAWMQVGRSDGNTAAYNLLLQPSGGNVGIGTTLPAAKLNVVDSTALTAQFSGYSFASAANNARAASGSLRLGNGSGSTGLLIDYTDQGQTLALIKNLYTINVLSELRLQSPFISLYTGTTAAEKMRITPAGGISFGSTGTAYGASGEILKSNGNASPTWVAASTVIGGPYLPLTGGTLSGPGNLTVGGTLSVTGITTLNGQANVGSVVPRIDSTFSLGSNTLRFASIYGDGLTIFRVLLVKVGYLLNILISYGKNTLLSWHGKESAILTLK